MKANAKPRMKVARRMRGHAPKKHPLRRVLSGFTPAIAAGAIGAAASVNAQQVYDRLEKPDWAPPAQVFGPVWSGLYAMIGFSGFRMASRTIPKRVWVLHYLQLGLNASWSWAFFKPRDKNLSLTVIGALNIVLTAELIALWRHDRKAALALMPYSAWVAFATALNASVEDFESAT